MIRFFAVTALLLTPWTAAADWNRGRAAFEAGDHESAVRELSEVTEAQPDWWGGHLLLGRSLAALDRPAEALASFESALALEPERLDVRLVLARTALQADQPAKALAALEGRSEDGTNGGLLLRLRATARLQLGDATGALADLSGLPLHDVQVAELRSRASRVVGDLDAVVVEGRRLVSDDPSNAARRRRLVADLQALALGTSTSASRREDLCREASDTAAPLLTGNPSAADLLLGGATALCARDLDLAIERLELALARDHDDLRILASLGDALTRAQRWEEAAHLLEPRRALADQRPIGFPLAVAYEGLGRYDEAIQIYADLDLDDRVRQAEERRRIADRNRKLKELEAREKELKDMMNDLESSSAGAR